MPNTPDLGIDGKASEASPPEQLLRAARRAAAAPRHEARGAARHGQLGVAGGPVGGAEVLARPRPLVLALRNGGEYPMF